MDLSRLLKLALVIAALFIAWKVVLPRLKGSGGEPASSPAAAGHESCVAGAEHASNAWGSGVGRFANPPYDIDAWSNFQSDINSKIAAAEAQCTCSDKSCVMVRSAMSELRGLISEMDSSIRSGAPQPSGLVQRQESIDTQIIEARALSQSGK